MYSKEDYHIYFTEEEIIELIENITNSNKKPVPVLGQALSSKIYEHLDFGVL